MDTVELFVADDDDVIQQNTQDFAIDHEDKFKHCMATYNIEDGTKEIVLAISFYESRYNIQLVIKKDHLTLTGNTDVNSMKDVYFMFHLEEREVQVGWK